MSLNVPNGGRGGGPRGPGGGNQAPPDLDELWRNFNRRLSELFGRKRPAGEQPPRMPSAGPRPGGAGLVGGGVPPGWAGGGLFTLGRGPRGHLETLGKIPRGTRPGLPPRVPPAHPKHTAGT